jgi:hypothetical protein
MPRPVPEQRIRNNEKDRKQLDTARRESMKAYRETNKFTRLKRQILNRIDDGGCVQERTLDNKNYAWTDAEKNMLIKCRENRKDRYVIDPIYINKVIDKRYRRPYPWSMYDRNLHARLPLTVKDHVNNSIRNINTDDLDRSENDWMYKLNALGRKQNLVGIDVDNHYKIYTQRPDRRLTEKKKPVYQSLYQAYMLTAHLKTNNDTLFKIINKVNNILLNKEIGKNILKFSRTQTNSDTDPVTDHHIRALAIAFNKPIIVVTMQATIPTEKNKHQNIQDFRPIIKVFPTNKSKLNNFDPGKTRSATIDVYKDVFMKAPYDVYEWNESLLSYDLFINTFKDVRDYEVLLWDGNDQFYATEPDFAIDQNSSHRKKKHNVRFEKDAQVITGEDEHPNNDDDDGSINNNNNSVDDDDDDEPPQENISSSAAVHHGSRRTQHPATSEENTFDSGDRPEDDALYIDKKTECMPIDTLDYDLILEHESTRALLTGFEENKTILKKCFFCHNDIIKLFNMSWHNDLREPKLILTRFLLLGKESPEEKKDTSNKKSKWNIITKYLSIALGVPDEDKDKNVNLAVLYLLPQQCNDYLNHIHFMRECSDTSLKDYFNVFITFFNRLEARQGEIELARFTNKSLLVRKNMMDELTNQGKKLRPASTLMKPYSVDKHKKLEILEQKTARRNEQGVYYDWVQLKHVLIPFLKEQISNPREITQKNWNAWLRYLCIKIMFVHILRDDLKKIVVVYPCQSATRNSLIDKLKKNDENFYVMDTGNFVMSNHKTGIQRTSQKRGYRIEYDFTLDESFKAELNDFIVLKNNHLQHLSSAERKKKQNVTNNRYKFLFHTFNGTLHNNISDIMKNVKIMSNCLIQFSVNMFRHSYASHHKHKHTFLKTMVNQRKKDDLIVASKLMHTLKQNEVYEHQHKRYVPCNHYVEVQLGTEKKLGVLSEDETKIDIMKHDDYLKVERTIDANNIKYTELPDAYIPFLSYLDGMAVLIKKSDGTIVKGEISRNNNPDHEIQKPYILKYINNKKKTYERPIMLPSPNVQLFDKHEVKLLQADR